MEVDREGEKNYYESLVLSRMARLKEKVTSDLEQCLSDYKAKYETLLREYTKNSERFIHSTND